MYYRDHQPPHFHVRYGGQKAIISLETFGLLYGSLTPRVYGLVVEWASQHQSELRNDWQLAQSFEPLNKIKPLE
jgi:hypothetical protein